MTQPNLRRLKQSTEEILSTLTPKDCPEDPVNWSDLHCTEAKSVVNDDGDEYLEVCIEEASPNSDNLRSLICQRLKDVGWDTVAVVLEW